MYVCSTFAVTTEILLYWGGRNLGCVRVRVTGLHACIASRRITLEVCPTSNLQTMPELKKSLLNHPLKRMMEDRLSLAVNTDNRTVSNCTLTGELRQQAAASRGAPGVPAPCTCHRTTGTAAPAPSQARRRSAARLCRCLCRCRCCCCCSHRRGAAATPK